MNNEKKLLGKIYSGDENNFVSYEKNQEDNDLEGFFANYDNFTCGYCGGIIEWEEGDEARKRIEEYGHIIGLCSQCCSGGYLAYPILAIYTVGDANDYTDEEGPVCEGECIIHRREITS